MSGMRGPCTTGGRHHLTHLSKGGAQPFRTVPPEQGGVRELGSLALELRTRGEQGMDQGCIRRDEVRGEMQGSLL